MPIGVESAHGFGDIYFNISLIRELKNKYNDEMWVAARTHCKDALFNIPWVDKIVEIQEMGQGIIKLKDMGCDPVFQITQNVKFVEFNPHGFANPFVPEMDLGVLCEGDAWSHSLVHTPLWTGRQLHCPPNFDNKPIFIPTDDEILKTESMVQDRPTIAIESVYTSGQSWSDKRAIDAIVSKYADTHRILWLSNQGAPEITAVDDMLRFTRRECISCLRTCDIFFSVGSGFFCASLGLPEALQPKKIVCLWTDDVYKYEDPLNEYKWHPDITWIHNHDELNEWILQSTNQPTNS